MSSIFHLFYRSLAATHISQEVVNSILEVAIHKNRVKKLTGILLFRAGHFMQLLEGNKQDVQETYQIISRDRRHCNIKIILECESNTRLFPDWNMGYIKDENMDTITSQAISGLKDLDLKKSSPQDILSILKIFNSKPSKSSVE